MKRARNNLINYLQVWAACRQHDLMSFKILTLGCQRAIDQCAAFQQRIEHAYQCALVVVPAKTKMLVVSRHFYHSPNRTTKFDYFKMILQKVNKKKKRHWPTHLTT